MWSEIMWSVEWVYVDNNDVECGICLVWTFQMWSVEFVNVDCGCGDLLCGMWIIEMWSVEVKDVESTNVECGYQLCGNLFDVECGVVEFHIMECGQQFRSG